MYDVKKESIKLIQQLPDDCTITDIISELHFKQKVEKGLNDIDEGRIVSHEDVKNRMSKWAQSVGR